MTQIEIEAEIQRCKNPVYFYNNYILVNGKKPLPIELTEEEFKNQIPTKDFVILKSRRRSFFVSLLNASQLA